MRMSFLFLFPAIAFGCGPRFSTTGPGDEPLSTDQVNAGANAALGNPTTEPDPGQSQSAPVEREVLIGEMCPTAASGRPAVLPLVLRTLTWSVDAEALSLPIERHAARSFSVFSWDGRRAGVFSVAGAADGVESSIAIGAYAGSSPCDLATGQNTFERDTACVATQSECGLAVAQVERPRGMNRPYEEDPDPLELPTGGACVVGDKLVVDIDGDQLLEAYATGSFLSPSRAPAEEVLAVPQENASCTPRFAQDHVIKTLDPRHFRGMHLIGVLDLDADGRKELIMVFQYEEKRTWAVYSAISSVGRLELMAETVPWPRR